MNSFIIKYLVMIAAALCAIGCLVYAVIEGNIIIGILSLVSSFLPIGVWFFDTRDNEKTQKGLREKITDLEDYLTIKVL